MIMNFFLVLSLIQLSSSISNTSLDIEYIDTNVTDFDDCSLSFQLDIIHQSSFHINNTHIQLIFYWIHSQISQEINSKSWLYNIDQLTNDFWSEYYLYLNPIDIDSSTSTSLDIVSCVTQTQIQQIIATEIENNGLSLFSFLFYIYILHKSTKQVKN